MCLAAVASAAGSHGQAASGRGTVSPPPVRVPAAAVYVTNEVGGDLSVIDAATTAVVATISLGKRPRGLVVSPDQTLLYVALSGSAIGGPTVDESKLPPPDRKADGIGVVNLRQQKLVRMLPAGPDPEQLDISADGHRLFVANEDAGQLTIVDTSAGRIVGSIKVGGEPEGVTVQPGGAHVWVTSEQDGAVYVTDVPAQKVLKAIAVGPRPRSIAFLKDGSRAYVPAENGASLTLIDAIHLRPLQTIDLGKGMRPMRVAVSAMTACSMSALAGAVSC